MLPQPAVDLVVGRFCGFRNQTGSIATQIQRNFPIAGAKRTAPHPHDLSHRDELVQQARAVSADPGSDDVALDHACRKRGSLQLEHDLEQPIHTSRLGANPVPSGQEARECFGRDRLDLMPERGEGPPSQDLQDLRVAVLAAFGGSAKLARDNVSMGGQAIQRRFDLGCWQGPPRGRIGGDEWDVTAGPSPQQGVERLWAGHQEDFGKPDRKIGAEGLAIAAGILRGDPARFARQVNSNGASFPLQTAQPFLRDATGTCLVGCEVT